MLQVDDNVRAQLKLSTSRSVISVDLLEATRSPNHTWHFIKRTVSRLTDKYKIPKLKSIIEIWGNQASGSVQSVLSRQGIVSYPIVMKPESPSEPWLPYAQLHATTRPFQARQNHAEYPR